MARDNSKRTFVVAPGISTCGIKGIIDQGKEVTPEDFEKGESEFKELVRRGVLVPKSAPEPAVPEAELANAAG